jgi:hypothetical protein
MLKIVFRSNHALLFLPLTPIKNFDAAQDPAAPTPDSTLLYS